jgi:hypothetical protein
LDWSSGGEDELVRKTMDTPSNKSSQPSSSGFDLDSRLASGGI